MAARGDNERTTLQYGYVKLPNCETKTFRQTTVMDDSDTDLIYHKFLIRVATTVSAEDWQSWVAPEYLDFITLPLPANATTAALQDFLHGALMHPRGYLSYKAGGSPLLTVDANQNTPHPFRDVNNGPKPRVCEITHIAGMNAFRVEFEVEAHTVNCRVPTENSYFIVGDKKIVPGRSDKRVLNNRWTLTETKDANFYTERVWDGQLRVAHHHFWPHLMRYLVVPPLQLGYRRMQQKFVQSADGLKLNYSITDKQQHRAPPDPAVDWNATYTESTGEGGAIGYAQVNVDVRGGPTSPQARLFVAAALIVQGRLGNIRRNFGAPGQVRSSALHLMGASITEFLHENRIVMQVNIRHATTAQRYLNLFAANLGKPLAIRGYNPFRWTTPALYDGITPNSVFATYLQTPCNTVHGIAKPVILQTNNQQEQYAWNPGVAEVYQVAILPSWDAALATTREHIIYPYTRYKVDSYLQTYEGIAGAPTANDDDDEDADAMSFVRLHKPATYMTVIVRAIRTGKWPKTMKMPEEAEDLNGIKMRLMRSTIHPKEPKLMADGQTRQYEVHVKAVYMMARKPKETEKIGVGAAAWTKDKSAQNAVAISTIQDKDVFATKSSS